MTDEDAQRLAMIRRGDYGRAECMRSSGTPEFNIVFVLRLLDEALAERQWRPIETAPKDGTAIFLLSRAYEDDYSHPARCSIGKWLAEGTSWVDQYGTAGEAEDVCELAQTGVWSSGGGWFEPNEVTHWMPLPESPK